MKKEIELKFRVRGFAPIRRKLRAMGAKLLWKGKEKNWFFDTKDRKLLKRDSTIRIKTMDDMRLTLKERKHVERGVKVAHEFQIIINDFETTKMILKHLGLRQIFYYTKRREHWKLGRALVEIDTLNSGKKFVEIEGTHASIKNLAKKFRLDFTNSTTKSYTQILGMHK